MEKLGAQPFVIPRRAARPREDGLTLRFSRGLSRALASDRATTVEWGVAIVGLYFLGRTPVLFMRRRLTRLIGGPTHVLWQDDWFIAVVFVSVMLATVAFAVGRVDTTSLLRQKPLLAFCAFAWISSAWSVEPGVTAWRSALFAGTAAVGWYLGSRFSLEQQPMLLVGAATIGALSSAIATAIWPHLGTRTRPFPGHQWSGIYVNRNQLALAMSIGLLGAVFLAWTSGRRRLAYVGAAVVFVFWIAVSGSRTGPVAIAATLGICALVVVLRRLLAATYSPAVGASYLGAIVFSVGALAYALLPTILQWLGRSPTLSKRTRIWELARWFASLKPWHGWGFDALWANRRAIGQAQAAYGGTLAARPEGARPGGWPFAAHNGYYEILIGLGALGLILLVCFLAFALWRAFKFAWAHGDIMSLWPFAFLVFIVLVNCTESMFIPSEALWALTVAAAVRATESARDHGT